jgi:hypothetical protein
MSHVEGIDRDQMTLFPEALDDYVSQENQCLPPADLPEATRVSTIPLWTVHLSSLNSHLVPRP